MEVINKRGELQKKAADFKRQGKSIGLVPTMGYLHEGHESLIKKARQDNDIVIVSDFVNPIQFGPKEDLATYPRDFDMDKEICERLGADIMFYPSLEDMYDEDRSVNIHISQLTEGLCGASRPGHFDGVCVVVNKLFNLSLADRAYFGEKDAQQLAVIRRMVRDLDMPIQIVGCPIIREADGLAKSSRNVRLTQEERAKAPQIHQAMLLGRKLIESGEKDVKAIIKKVTEEIEKIKEMDIDYIEIVTWDGLRPTDTINGPVLLACAIRLGSVRLIDNEIVL